MLSNERRPPSWVPLCGGTPHFRSRLGGLTAFGYPRLQNWSQKPRPQQTSMVLSLAPSVSNCAFMTVLASYQGKGEGILRNLEGSPQLPETTDVNVSRRPGEPTGQSSGICHQLLHPFEPTELSQDTLPNPVHTSNAEHHSRLLCKPQETFMVAGDPRPCRGLRNWSGVLRGKVCYSTRDLSCCVQLSYWSFQKQVLQTRKNTEGPHERVRSKSSPRESHTPTSIHLSISSCVYIYTHRHIDVCVYVYT